MVVDSVQSTCGRVNTPCLIPNDPHTKHVLPLSSTLSTSSPPPSPPSSSSLLEAYDHERKVIDKSIAGSETPGKVASQDTADDNVMMIIRTKILLMLKHSQLFKSGHC